MALAHVAGVPRIGPQRELKFALEAHWRGELDEASLRAVGSGIRQANWRAQHAAELDFVAVGDFAFYDPMLNHVALYGCAPARFGFDAQQGLGLAEYFQLARGNAERHAMEMTKWFDTNYHYLVPEFTPDTRFALDSGWLFDEVAEAITAGFRPRPTLIGPVSFLFLGKEKRAGFDRLDLLDRLLPVVAQALTRLKAQGVEWVQLDEPVLALDLPVPWRAAFERAYHALASCGVKLVVASGYGPLRENLTVAARLPVAGLHVDAVRGLDELPQLVDWLPTTRVLSVGIVDGRNVWQTDLAHALSRLEPLARRLGERLWIASTCSLAHVPAGLAAESGLDPELRSWLAFAAEKLAELGTLKTALDRGPRAVEAELAANAAALAARRSSPRVHDAAVTARLAALPATADRRAAPYAKRAARQAATLDLPPFPTTTIGSFPQTGAIRAARAAHKRGESSDAEYRTAMRGEIEFAVRRQEALGLDVLVHGEAERNDMVEYFGEQLAGYAFTQFGWVQSYGSRCVKPPLLFGDVSRPAPMTVEWTRYAQSLTDRPMKGMLTGPVTMLQWSFVRDDVARETVALQLALAIRDEAVDLETAGLRVIQIDEPAFREGLPLRRGEWQRYLAWAGRAFRIAASGVADATQIHTHMCYSEFNDILPAIAALDADVITIETSRSDMELLRGFGEFAYPNAIGPGVYDIHSPRVPPTAEMLRLLGKALEVIPAERLWVNPDCGLKTRGWPETEAALANMVEAARALRAGPLVTAA